MSALKLVAGSTVVDAVKNPCYVVYVPRLKLFLACPEAEAQGVASRNGTTYWHIEGKDEFGVDGYQTVDAISISDEEADELITALEAGEEPIGETQPEQLLTLASVYAQVQSTQAELDSLTAAIEKGLSL